MATYLLLYHGGGTPESADEQAKVMAAWGQWMGKLGSGLVDGGNPTSGSKTVDSQGSVGAGDTADPVTGYSIIKADSLDQAVELAKDSPLFLGPRKARIEVYETFEAM
jgi:hypothetical protein